MDTGTFATQCAGCIGLRKSRIGMIPRGAEGAANRIRAELARVRRRRTTPS